MIKLLDGVEATGASNSVKVPKVEKHSVQVDFTTDGGVTALVVDLEGSLDNSKFYQLASFTFGAADLTAKGAMFHVVNKAIDYIRVNITTLTETGTTAVTVLYEPKEG